MDIQIYFLTMLVIMGFWYVIISLNKINSRFASLEIRLRNIENILKNIERQE